MTSPAFKTFTVLERLLANLVAVARHSEVVVEEEVSMIEVLEVVPLSDRPQRAGLADSSEAEIQQLRPGLADRHLVEVTLRLVVTEVEARSEAAHLEAVLEDVLVLWMHSRQVTPSPTCSQAPKSTS